MPIRRVVSSLRIFVITPVVFLEEILEKNLHWVSRNLMSARRVCDALPLAKLFSPSRILFMDLFADARVPSRSR